MYWLLINKKNDIVVQDIFIASWLHGCVTFTFWFTMFVNWDCRSAAFTCRVERFVSHGVWLSSTTAPSWFIDSWLYLLSTQLESWKQLQCWICFHWALNYFSPLHFFAVMRPSWWWSKQYSSFLLKHRMNPRIPNRKELCCLIGMSGLLFLINRLDTALAYHYPHSPTT